MKKSDDKFINYQLGLIPWVLLIGIVFFMALISGNLSTTFGFLKEPLTVSIIALPTIAFVLIARAGGLDWSIGSVMTLCAAVSAKLFSTGHGGILLPLMIGLTIGILHGFLSIYLKWPSIIFSLFTSSAYITLSMIILDGKPLAVTIQPNGIIILLIMAIVFFILAFILNMFTPLGRPMRERLHAINGEKLSYFLAYIMAFLIAAVAGILWMTFQGSAIPTPATNEMDTLIILLLIGSSFYFDNPILPLVMAIIGSLWTESYSTLMTVLKAPFFWKLPISIILMMVGMIFDRVYKPNYIPAFIDRKNNTKRKNTLLKSIKNRSKPLIASWPISREKQEQLAEKSKQIDSEK